MRLEELRELLPLYALHALPKNQEQQVEAALAQHPELWLELRALQETAADLSEGVVKAVPNPALKIKLMGRIKEASSPTVLPLPQPSAPRVPRPLPRWLMAAAVAAAIGLGWGGSIAYRYYPLVQAFLDPSTRYETLVDENQKPCGRAFYRSNGQTIVWTNLSPAPAGKTYQFWGINQNNHIALDTYNGGFYVFEMPVGYASLHITEEKAGGSQTPSQIRVLPQQN